MKETNIEVLRQIVSRTDKTGNEKVEMLIEFIGQQLKNCNLQNINECAPNREFKGTLKTYSGFTHSNRNILHIEVAGVENYIGNTLKVGDEVNIQHWR